MITNENDEELGVEDGQKSGPVVASVRVLSSRGWAGNPMKDIKDQGFTEEQILERAAELRERHEKLLLENEQYAALFYSLPDRSDFVSGVPIVENVVTRMITLHTNMRREEEGLKRAAAKRKAGIYRWYDKNGKWH